MVRGMIGLLLLVSVVFLLSSPGLVRAEKKHEAEEKGVKSLNSDLSTSIAFTNKSGKTIKVYWLDFEGNRKLYQTLDDDESCEQQTYVSHPWVITDKNDDAWYVFYPDAQPRTIEIVAPEKK